MVSLVEHEALFVLGKILPKVVVLNLEATG